ncbi:PTS system maltose- and glucose-specific EIICB component [Clostridium puniceum]|uniref:PTS system maltose-and glucose-specific EIICB component n=1 Tax=Clostridium puniceum TaxID=29367 RepID=A0A1S8TWG1_9CLOT|nr:PTS transporter subunit EIIC [Clostridium puniceum]OOM81922.1 PTS system maltose- and glucose-specific EIICB component [Clostridium puniceum]
MKEKLLSLSQKFSQAAVQPVMFLAIMGTGLAIAVIMQLSFMPSFIIFIGTLLKTMMNAMLNNLSIIFCVGLTTAFAKTKKVDAAIISLIVYIIFLAGNNAWLTSQNILAQPGAMGLFGTGQNLVLGFQVVDMNVFLGIILGCITGYVFNKASNIQFVEMFRVYGGSRLVFIIMIPITLILAIVLSYVWPVINYGISCLSVFMKGAGSLGVFVYAFGNRFLIPTGLHHLLWMPFCFTGFGGSAQIDGNTVQGAVNIFYAEMGSGANLTAIDPSIRFATFGFAKIFASLGIVLAMIKTAKPENKSTVKGLLIPTLFVSMVAGITEPLDFAFLFISPLLWLVHGLLTGFSEMLLWILGSRTYSIYGLLDTIVCNSVIDPKLSKIYIFFTVGIVMAIVWYFTFVFLIKKFDIKTPGREDSVNNETSYVSSANDDSSDQNAELFIEGLGGAENIIEINNCFTRLRIDVNDINKVNKQIISKGKQKGVVIKGNNVQIIIGMTVESEKEKLVNVLSIKKHKKGVM